LDEAKVYIFKKANLLTTKSPMGPKIIPRKTAAGIFIDKKNCRLQLSFLGVLLCVGGRGATGDPFKSVLIFYFYIYNIIEILSLG